MFAICVESSHERGMGHLFRAVSFVHTLERFNYPYVILVNDHESSIRVLKEGKLNYRVYDPVNMDWEKSIISSNQIKVWINDRFFTTKEHVHRVKNEKVFIATMDDRGEGAISSDLHFAPLMFNESLKPSVNLLSGPEFLILNQEIDTFKRLRTLQNKILITLGGSDTYGATIKVAKILSKIKWEATILLGPSFLHHKELQKVPGNFKIVQNVPSLIEFFNEFDLAITGGGVTPFEANASGLPCLVVANEDFEVPVGKFLNSQGSSLFVGHHDSINESAFNENLNLEKMSQIGMKTFSTHGAENILKKIQQLCPKL